VPLASTYAPFLSEARLHRQESAFLWQNGVMTELNTSFLPTPPLFICCLLSVSR
jgi:hypothetical protein